MAVPRSTRWEIQPHTQIKHAILRRYLQAWLPIMGQTNGRIVFIDGFAGPGRYSGGETGSPLIALQTVLEHHAFRTPRPGREVAFLFVEKEEDRAVALEQEIADLDIQPGWVQHEVLVGGFEEHMTRILDRIELGGGGLAPTFAFIDPFGFKGIPLELIARIVRHKKCECLISFMYEPINRFLSHPDEAIQRNIDALFGTKAWQRILDLADPTKRRDDIVDLYRQQLHKVAGLTFVRTFEMINEDNRRKYVLYFGTNAPLGLSKMKEAMWDADPTTGQVFSDRTDPRQNVLLKQGAEEGLRDLLRSRFLGKGSISIDELERFVLEDPSSPYSETRHLKQRTLGPLENEALIEVQRPTGKRERAGEYPRGTRIRFFDQPKEPEQGLLFP